MPQGEDCWDITATATFNNKPSDVENPTRDLDHLEEPSAH